MATVVGPQDDEMTVPLRDYIKLGFDNINGRLDTAQNERAMMKADIDRVDGRIDRLMFTIIGAAFILTASVIGAAAGNHRQSIELPEIFR